MTTTYFDEPTKYDSEPPRYFCSICFRYFEGDAHTDPETDDDVCENCCPVCSHDEDGE